MSQETIANSVTASPDLSPLVAELEDYRRQFEAIKQDARELLNGLTDTQFNWRSAPGKWSIAECLAHLNVTGQVYLPLIERRVNQARAEKVLGRGPFRHGFLGNLFIRATEPPVKRIRVKAPKIFAPQPEHMLAVIVPAFMSLQEYLLRQIRAADGLDLGRVKITSPVGRLLKLSLGQVFAFIAAHERRHLWQARQVRNDTNFPNV